MIDKKENYMDFFKTPEEFIRFQITRRDGIVCKDDLISFAAKNGVNFNAKMKKSDIYDAIRSVMSFEEVLDGLKPCGLGVSSRSFQLKFDITHEEVKRMARLGFIHVTGTETFRMFSKNCHCDLYSVFDYFRLTKDDVHSFLAINSKGTRKIKKTED